MLLLRLPLKAATVALAFGVCLTLACWLVVESEFDARIHASVDDLTPAKAGLVLGTSRLLPERGPNP